ncbi:o-succinylbenzoate synthase [Staphylococcus americanisciuri]|uniref:o-succinylbenzoate synthase n=1 Tax=Staphylococcus americanisciuri TaxID=2973940 RepID=A0ABT2F0B2_9STAP|nr:o-succinylbenzoate synthase [Staphylococcus americanisciuri]MCS4485277.1 o-succinylbenzoate synthase [Staphylococcus americanisciuri]
MKLLELHFYQFTPTFKHTIQTPKVTLKTRRTLFIGLIDDTGNEWFGECNVFETDWYYDETIETVKQTLSQWFETIKGNVFMSFAEAQDLVGDLESRPAARATVMMALYQMFHELPSFEVPMTITVNGDIQRRLVRLDYAARIKIKWNPHIVEQVKMLTAMYPDTPITTDANQMLCEQDLPLLRALARYQLTYIEEPFPTLIDYRCTKDLPPIAIDEQATDEATIMRAIQHYGVKVVIVKPFRVGGIDRAMTLIELLRNQGVTVVVGGMYECGLSRYFTALLSRYGDYAGDVTPANYYFEEDVVEQSGQLNQGKLYFEPPVINQHLLTCYS